MDMLLGTSQAEGVGRHPGSRFLCQKCTVLFLKIKRSAYRDSELSLPSAGLGRGHKGNLVKRES